MDTRSTLDELKDRAAGVAAPDAVVHLYRQAFAEFGTRALWSSKPARQPTVAAVLSITESLRVEGDLDARRLAERIEEACRAALGNEREKLIRQYAAGEITWSALRDRGFENYIQVLGALGELGLRPPISPMDGPNVAARERGRALIREALRAQR